MLNLLVKTLVFKFYEQHASLFLVICYLLFGAVEGSQIVSYQYALLISVCSSPLILGIVFTLWIIYAARCYLFVKQKLTLPSFLVSSELTKMPKPKQYVVWLKVYAFMFMPILGYAFIMVYVSALQNFWYSLIAILVGLIGLFTTLISLTFQETNYAFNSNKIQLKLRLIKIEKPFWSWPLFYLIHNQPVLFFACKLISLFAFKSVLWLFADVGADIRVFLTATLAVVLSHANLLFIWIKFDIAYLSFARSLPISLLKRIVSWLTVMLILLIPEFALLIWSTHFDVQKIGICILFCMASLFTLFTFVYLLRADMERYMKYILYFFFVSMFAILAAFYLVYSLAILLCSIVVLLKYYQKIELKELI